MISDKRDRGIGAVPQNIIASRSKTIPRSKDECPMCGRMEPDRKGPFCIECSRSLGREDPPFFDTLLVYSIISLLISFVVVMERAGLKGPFDIGLDESDVSSFLMLVLTLLPLIPVCFLKRDQLFSFGSLRTASALSFPLMLSWGLVWLLASKGDSREVFHSVVLLMVSLFLGGISIRTVIRTGWYRLLPVFIGSFLFEVGFAGSLGVLNLPDLLWMTKGPILLSAGAVLFLFSSFRTLRSMDMVSIAGAPVVLVPVPILSSVTLLSIVSSNGAPSEAMVVSLGNLFLLICLGTTALAAKRWVDHVMLRSELELKGALNKGKELVGKGELFYGLQQIDRSVRKNPLDGFGRTSGTDNPLFDLEGKEHTGQYTFDPPPTEMALNEKGMTYASQGKFSDATRQFMEATRRDPQFLEPYWNLSNILAMTPGKKSEAARNLDMLIASRSLYMRRWLKKGVQRDHAEWMCRCLDLYGETLRYRAELIERLSKEGDIWTYYRLVG